MDTKGEGETLKCNFGDLLLINVDNITSFFLVNCKPGEGCKNKSYSDRRWTENFVPADIRDDRTISNGLLVWTSKYILQTNDNRD